MAEGMPEKISEKDLRRFLKESGWPIGWMRTSTERLLYVEPLLSKYEKALKEIAVGDRGGEYNVEIARSALHETESTRSKEDERE